ncbi:unnamed protein product [Lactuca saligna]|uniref:Uncharacterized protein n=1 Tax=Lactuca saligna TaxID=75948 RepID=A0AA35ZYK1_LACSI|nr:unnamed protein product [Lactuca saligna]
MHNEPTLIRLECLGPISYQTGMPICNRFNQSSDWNTEGLSVCRLNPTALLEPPCIHLTAGPHQEPSCQADDGANTAIVDDYEPFIDDYSLYADYDAEFNVQTSFEQQPKVDYQEGMVSDDSGEAFYSESDHGSEDGGDDSDDNEYNVDESNIQFDVDVDMSEFHNDVDVDENGILNNHSKDEGNDMVDDELEVIATDDYQFAGFNEDDRKRLLKELSKSSTCSHGEVHVKPFQIGQVFKTKCDVKNYMDSHAVATRRSLYLAKNDKIWIRVNVEVL